MQSLWLAVQFLTTLPARVAEPVTPLALGRSLAWYPLVGAALGALIGAACWLLRLAGLHASVAAALGLALALALTGALHLDGLLDTADGAFAPRAPAERLAIMADPRVGAFGLAAGVSLLLVKFAALSTLPADGVIAAMVAACCLGRTVIVGAAVLAPRAKATGLAARVAGSAGRREIVLATATGLLVAVAVAGVAGLVWAVAAGLVSWAVARWLMARLGGLTGDTYGALNEVTEGVVLALAGWRGLAW